MSSSSPRLAGARKIWKFVSRLSTFHAGKFHMNSSQLLNSQGWGSEQQRWVNLRNFHQKSKWDSFTLCVFVDSKVQRGRRSESRVNFSQRQQKKGEKSKTFPIFTFYAHRIFPLSLSIEYIFCTSIPSVFLSSFRALFSSPPQDRTRQIYTRDGEKIE